MTYALDATPQGAVDVQVRMGTASGTFCARFTAPAKKAWDRRTGSTNKRCLDAEKGGEERARLEQAAKEMALEEIDECLREAGMSEVGRDRVVANFRTDMAEYRLVREGAELVWRLTPLYRGGSSARRMARLAAAVIAWSGVRMSTPAPCRGSHRRPERAAVDAKDFGHEPQRTVRTQFLVP